MGHVLVDPVDHEPVGSQQSQCLAVFNRLQRADPGIELLLWQFGFQLTETAMPQRTLHGFAPTNDPTIEKLAR